MFFTIPAIAAIGARLKTAFRAYLPGTDAWIEPNNLSISAKAFALALYEVYQRILWLYRQLFASTADADHLEKRHAAEYGLTRKAANAAAGRTIVPQAAGDDPSLPTGFKLIREDGLVYAVTEATSAQSTSGGSATFVLPVKCTTPGAVSNTLPGAVLTIPPQAGVTLAATTGTVDEDGLGGGADLEDIEDLRARVLQRKRFTPMAGANGDYVRWALEVAGVTRAFATGFANQPPGAVVYPLFDKTRPQGIPLQSDLDAVAAYVETQRPTAARVFYVAAQLLQVDVEISNLEADTSTNRAAIAAQLGKLFAERAAVSTADDPLVFRRGWIDGAIERALGPTIGFTRTAPVNDVVVPFGSMPFLGNVTYPAPVIS